MAEGRPIALAAWNSCFHPCEVGVTQQYDQKVINWINGLEASGGTEIFKAIEAAMVTYPDARNVVTMTDGAIHPDGPGERWRGMVAQHRQARFSFIALARSACTAALEGLALEAGGDYTQCL